jgi:hypothetical protein
MADGGARAVPSGSADPANLANPQLYEKLKEDQAKFNQQTEAALATALEGSLSAVQPIMASDSSSDLQSAQADLESALNQVQALQAAGKPAPLSMLPAQAYESIAPGGLPVSNTDLNCDGKTDSIDALWSLRSTAALPPLALTANCFQVGANFGGRVFGDVNCDGTADAVDAIFILRIVVGLPAAPGSCAAAAPHSTLTQLPTSIPGASGLAGTEGVRTAHGYLHCRDNGNEFPLAHATVELWNDWSGAHFSDSKLGESETDANGYFSIDFSFNGTAKLFAKFVLRNLSTESGSGVHVGNLIGDDNWSTADIAASGDVDIGNWWVGTNFGQNSSSCAVFAGADGAYRDYENQHEFPADQLPPSGIYGVQILDALTAGVPWTDLGNTHWPPGFSPGDNSPRVPVPVVSLHEFSHTVRQWFDAKGDGAHWLGDVVSFSYTQFHSCDKVTNDGFAFNEGWAEFWAKSYCPGANPNAKDVEGNVAGALDAISKCLDVVAKGIPLYPKGHEVMTEVLQWADKGTIHTYDDFVAQLANFIAAKGHAYSPYAACAQTPFVQEGLTLGNGNTGEQNPIPAADIEARLQQETTNLANIDAQLVGQLPGAQADAAAALAHLPCAPQCLAAFLTVVKPYMIEAQMQVAQLAKSLYEADGHPSPSLASPTPSPGDTSSPTPTAKQTAMPTPTPTPTPSPTPTPTASPTPVNQPPTAFVDAPTDNTEYLFTDGSDVNGFYKNVTLQGHATDPEQGTLTGSALVWTDSVNGGGAVTLGTGESLAVKLYTQANLVYTHVITLTAIDIHGAQSTATITVKVDGPIG